MDVWLGDAVILAGVIGVIGALFCYTPRWLGIFGVIGVVPALAMIIVAGAWPGDPGVHYSLSSVQTLGLLLVLLVGVAVALKAMLFAALQFIRARSRDVRAPSNLTPPPASGSK